MKEEKETYKKAILFLNEIIENMNNLYKLYLENTFNYNLLNNIDNYPFNDSLDEVIAKIEYFQETIEELEENEA